MGAAHTNVEVGDRVLVTDRYSPPYTGVIEIIHDPFEYVRRDDDPERSKSLEVVHQPYDQIELWDGPINGVETAVDVHVCPVLGCDYAIGVAGPVDPDEPDDFTDDIEAHRRGHELAAKTEDLEPVGALTAPPGVALVPPPALVQLDQDDAGHRVIAAALAFDELDDRREGLDVAGVDAWDTAREGLRQALADFREVNR